MPQKYSETSIYDHYFKTTTSNLNQSLFGPKAPQNLQKQPRAIELEAEIA